MKKISGFIFGLLFCAAVSVWAQTAIPYAQNTVFTYLSEFRYPGPDAWFGLVQENDPKTGAALYKIMHPLDRAIYFKHYPNAPHPGIFFDATVEVQLIRNTTGDTSMTFLKKYTGLVPPKDFKFALQNTMVNGQLWSRAEHRVLDKFKTPQGEQVQNLYRKIYMTLHNGVIYSLQLTTTEADSAADIAIFDASILKVEFGHPVKSAA